MTHEKAVELAHHAMVNSKSRAHGLVDALRVLGVIAFESVAHPLTTTTVTFKKREQTGNPQEDFHLQLQCAYGNGPYYIDQILLSLGAANLELVERK